MRSKKDRKTGSKEDGEISDDEVQIIEESPNVIPLESSSDEEMKQKKQHKEDEDFEDRVEKLAVQEILKETKISKIRAETSGTWHCELRKTNKRFLKSAIVATLNHNERESKRHRDRSERQLARFDRHNRHRDSDSSRRYVRNPFYDRNHDRYAEERSRNARHKYERAPRRSRSPNREIRFVKPRDLDERVLIPGRPSKKARVKEINFVAAHNKDEQFLGHDGTDLRMERIRKVLADKIPKQAFVPPFLEKERFFTLSGERVAGLTRQAAEEGEEEQTKLLIPIVPPQPSPILPPELVAFCPYY